jgi:hypothetical protein
MSYVAVKRKEAAQEDRAAEQMLKIRNVSVGRDPLYKPGWCERLLGREKAPVTEVTLHDGLDAIPPPDWTLLAAFPSLEEFYVFYWPWTNDEFCDVLERRPGRCIYRGPGPHDDSHPPSLRFNATLTSTKRAVLERLTGLRVLTICDVRIDNVTFLRNLSKLERLDLNATGVGDDVLDAVQACPNLTDLSLDYDDITDAGVSRLRSLHNLRWLSLRYTYLTDAGLKSLQHLKTLGTVQVEGTAVSKAACDETERATPGLSVIGNCDFPLQVHEKVSATSERRKSKRNKKQKKQGDDRSTSTKMLDPFADR